MDRGQPFTYLFYMLTIFVGGSLLFLIGFFPVSRSTAGNYEQRYNNEEPLKLFDMKLLPPTVKNNPVILMIIDAWRFNFFEPTYMPYIHESACHSIKLKVESPTVTMPRLKSITTGTISNFIDIVLNLGHVEMLHDSLLHRLSARGKEIVFAGDHTWTLLFQDLFLRQKANKDSFFVNDFNEGDTNVTTALKSELLLDDWQLLILHYLGLDHIGHVEGSRSKKIFSKLHEMDDVIKNVTLHPKFSNKILLVTGDHGMRNGGSHGGSEVEELYVPLVFYSNQCHKTQGTAEEYNQIDMTPTLAVLLGVDIPHSSIGCLISDFLMDFTMEEQLYYYYQNALHLVEKFRKKFDVNKIQNQGQTDFYFWLTEAEIEHKNFLKSNGTSLFSFEKSKQNYIRVSKNISKRLSESLVHYDNDLIVISLIVTTLTALSLLLNVLFEPTNILKKPNIFSTERSLLSAFLAAVINGIVHYFSLIYTRHFMYSILLTLPIGISIYLAIDIIRFILNLMSPMTYAKKSQFKLTIPWILLGFFLFHTFSLGSSSLIEEEHQTWYYLTPTMLVFLSIQNYYNNVKKIWNIDDAPNILGSQMWNMRYVVLVMVAIIGCRRLNQTGNKWLHLEDIGDILAKEENYIYLLLTFIGGLFLLFCFLRKYNSRLQMSSCSMALLSVFFYRQYTEHIVVLIVFWLSVVTTGLIHYRDTFCKKYNYGYETRGNLVELLRTNLTCCLLVSALLHKPHNVILLPAMLFTLEKSYQLCDNLYMKDKRVYNRCYVLVLKTVITIFIANMYYFFQGNSNSLTTIDLTPGYIGLTSYNAFVVGTFITMNTYCAPINAFLYLMWHMFNTQSTSLPLRQEKEQISNAQLLESTEEDLYLVISLFTATTVMPVAVYWLLLLGFRYHLFIYSVFAPKAFYECFHILVFYLNFIITNLYFRLFQ